MYVVGTSLIGDFWKTHPASEGELRALHALLASLAAEDLDETLKHVARFDACGAEIRLETVAIRIEVNRAANVARYAIVSALDEETG